MNQLKQFLRKTYGLLLKKKTPKQNIQNRAFIQELRGFRFYLSQNKSGPFFTAYHPDSHYIFKAYPEFDQLIKKFTAHNKVNNGGDTTRLWSFILNCKQIIGEGIEGDFAELGVWRGNNAAILAKFATTTGRKLLLFDTFEGFKEKDLVGIDDEKTIVFDNTSVNIVKQNMGEDDKNCIYVKGFFPDTLTDDHRSRQYAIVSLDCDLYAPTKAGLDFFYARMPKGGILFLHDYSSLHWQGSKLAIDEFCREKQEYVILMPDKSGSAFVRKSKEYS